MSKKQTVRQGPNVTGRSQFQPDRTLMVTSTTIGRMRSSSSSEGSQRKDIGLVMDEMSDYMAQTIVKIEQSVGPMLPRTDKKLLVDLRYQGKKLIEMAKKIQQENEELTAKIDDLEKKIATLEAKEELFEMKLDDAMEEIEKNRDDRIAMSNKIKSFEESMAEMKQMLVSLSFPSNIVTDSGYSTMSSGNIVTHLISTTSVPSDTSSLPHITLERDLSDTSTDVMDIDD